MRRIISIIAALVILLSVDLSGMSANVFAANSDQVDRVVCGIGVTIKGGNIK